MAGITNTNYIVNVASFGNMDIGLLLEPYVSGTKAITTNIRVNGSDLCNLYKVAGTSSLMSFNTGIQVNGADLSTLFAKRVMYTLTDNANINNTIVFNATASIHAIRLNAVQNAGDSASYSLNIVFPLTITNVSILCVAGGGGGGGGTVSPNVDVGRGGGGGGNYLFTNITLTGGVTYQAKIGRGGVKGNISNTAGNRDGKAGGETSLNNGTVIICGCTGGSGGETGGSGETGVRGKGGYVIGQTSLGKGGDGGGITNNATDSDSKATPLTINPVVTNTVSYCGGGGGTDNNKKGGGGGINGTAGTKFGSANETGEAGQTRGAGGGGGSNDGSSIAYQGGDGSSGLMIIYFSYPV